MQLRIGIVGAIVRFFLHMDIMWYLAEQHPFHPMVWKIPVGTLMGREFIKAVIGMMSQVCFTYLAWFGVINKRGCCCYLVCCSLGKPNLLAISILFLFCGVCNVICVIQDFSYSAFVDLSVPDLGAGSELAEFFSASPIFHLITLVVAFLLFIDGIALLYGSFEAFMIWRLSSPKVPLTGAEQTQGPKGSKGAVQRQVLGAPLTTDHGVAEMEGGGVKKEA